MTVYDVHGLLVRSKVELPAPRASASSAEFELDFAPPRPVPSTPPPGVLLGRHDEEGIGYSMTRDGDVLRLRLPAMCDMDIHPDGHVRVTPDVTAEPPVVPMLVCGSLASAILSARGECLLHANVVAVERGGIALVGGSGAGKTTLSGILCAAGARLVTEDLLRLRFDGDRPWCLPGITELRFRGPAAELADAFPASARVVAGDGRVAVRLPHGPGAPLASVVVPVPDREGDRVRSERVAGSDALMELLRYPRAAGWEERALRIARMRTLGRVARTAPRRVGGVRARCVPGRERRHGSAFRRRTDAAGPGSAGRSEG
ncbi:MAG: hypothetical protein LC722_03735 [Actinobacteria bacterium]|nr:hypothetical protein [Actinomycetota bacterium]